MTEHIPHNHEPYQELVRFDIYRVEPLPGVKAKAAISISEAARFMCVDEHEIEWSINEYGRCDTTTNVGDFVCVEAGDPYPGAMTQPSAYKPE